MDILTWTDRRFCPSAMNFVLETESNGLEILLTARF